MPELKKEEDVLINFAELEYDILESKYFYREGTPPAFIVAAVVKVSDDIFPHEMEIGYPIETALEHAKRDNEGLVKYVKKTLEGYNDKPESELLAFQSLEDDGLDLKLFMRSVLSQMSFRITKVN